MNSPSSMLPGMWRPRYTLAALTGSLRLVRRLTRQAPGLACLTYHDVPEACLANFRAQIREVTRRCTVLDYPAFAHSLARPEDQASDAVLITFDDAYVSNLRAAEVLEEFGIRAVFFVPTGFLACRTKAEVDRYIVDGLYARQVERAQLPERLAPMSWDDLRRLHAAGHTIAAHTKRHRHVKTLSDPAELRDDICQCADVIEQQVGNRVSAFAVPFGTVGSITPQALATAGVRYRHVFTSVRGNNRGAPALALRRETVSASEPPGYVAFQLEGGLWFRYRRARRMLDRMAAEAVRQ